MAEVFADTSGWAAFFVRTEPFHALADALMRSWQARGTMVVTTNYVVAELVALFTSPLRVPRVVQIQCIESLMVAPWIELIHVDPLLHADAWSLLKARQDKNWSLADCVSFVAMQQRGIGEALTADHHFEQAGFVRLLK
jgi:predicted nucleic acid-binding protein